MSSSKKKGCPVSVEVVAMHLCIYLDGPQPLTLRHTPWAGLAGMVQPYHPQWWGATLAEAPPDADAAADAPAATSTEGEGADATAADATAGLPRYTLV